MVILGDYPQVVYKWYINGMKPKRKYIRVKDRRQGLAPSQRTIDKFEKNANQWTLTPKQLLFTEYWLLPIHKDTFGDAYKAAIGAGFSPSYAKRITSNTEALEWVAEARKRLVSFSPLHTIKLLEEEARNANKSSDRIRAQEVIARIQGLFIDRSINQHIHEVQFTNEVPRPIIDTTSSVD